MYLYFRLKWDGGNPLQDDEANILQAVRLGSSAAVEVIAAMGSTQGLKNKLGTDSGAQTMPLIAIMALW